jgi:hypothetical protein
MRGAPADTTEDDVKLHCDRTLWQSTPVEDLPPSWRFLPGVDSVTQICHMHKIYAFEAATRGERYAPVGVTPSPMDHGESPPQTADGAPTPL